MSKTIPDINKRGRGRPKADTTAVLVRLPDLLLQGVDKFIDGEAALTNVKMSRPEAIRSLVAAILAREHYISITGPNYEGEIQK